MRALYKLLLSLITFLIFNTSAFAQCTELNGQDLTASYDQCSGNLTMEVYPIEFIIPDEWVNFIKVYFTDNSGSEVLIYEINDNSFSGSTSQTVNNGPNTSSREFHYRAYNGFNFTKSHPNANIVKWTIVWTDMPEYLYEDGQVQIRIEREYKSCPKPSDFNQTININSYNAPSGFAATNSSECNQVSLSWTNPSIPACLNSNWTTEIYRNDVLIQTVPYTTTSYSDAGAPANGSSVNYKLRTKINRGGGRNQYSDFTTNISGSRKTPPPTPNNLSVTNNKCDGTIDVTWGSSIGATAYQVDWGTSSQSNITNTTYTIENINRGQNYNIRVRANNECGNSSYSPTQSGLSPASPTQPTNFNVSAVGSSFELTWTDSNFETEYIVERSLAGGSGTTQFTVSQNATSYTDSDVNICEEYVYQVKAVNDCVPNGVASESRNAVLTTNLGNTFTSNALSASKGYFTNRVELTWTVSNNSNIIDGYKVYRRILGDLGDSTLITTINTSGSNIYIDNFADAGVLYEYFLIGEGDCNGTTLFTNIVSSIGFRASSGIINGEVSYEGGVAVENVKILVESSTGAIGNSVLLQPSESLIVEENNLATKITTTGEITLEAWIRPTDVTSTTWDVFFKSNAFLLGRNASGNLQFGLQIGAVLETVEAPDNLLQDNEWAHIAAVNSSDSIKLFVNGQKVASRFLQENTPFNSNDLVIGNNLNGNINEVRIWNVAKTDEAIFKDFSRRMVGSESGLSAYYNINEGVGNYIYDKSFSGSIFNKNHARKEGAGNLQWSNNIPTSSQLGNVAYTNAFGNYNIVVPYTGVGQNFVVIPSFETHQFNPSNQALYIGDGASVQNNINFLDKSSFPVSGSVFFQGTSCPVEGAFLKIDGENVIENGQPVQTDAAGLFEIQVPIGNHFVSVEKNGHVYSQGRFPPTGTFDFQAPVFEIEFIDSTLVKVVGRVVGGIREGNKIPGLGKSKNNIGQAEITFTAQQGGGCITTTFNTIDTSGEYTVFLPPLKYIPTVNIPSNLTIDFGVLSLLDLTNQLQITTEYDTLGMDSLTGEMFIDSIAYNKRQDYIYRVNPKIIVKDKDGISDFYGDSTYTYINNVTGDTIVRNLLTNPFPWPVFSEQDDDFLYRCLIKVYEEYVNLDNASDPKFDSVPTTDGKLIFNNQISELPELELELSKVNTPDSLNFLVYSFKTNFPNFNQNVSIPEYSFTRTFELNLELSNGTIVPWLPITSPPTGGDQIYRAYVLGTQSNGQQFVTEGPEVPEYVLRDPPGDGSSASRETGTTTVTEEGWNWNLGTTAVANNVIKVGAKFSVGVGVSTATDISNDISAGFSATIGGGRSGAVSVSTTNTQAYSTSSLAIGSGSDLFIGKSKNISFGIAEELAFIPNADCASLDCVGSSFGDFTPAIKKGLSIVPEGYNTTFIYNADFIENEVIPTLTELRNIILQTNPKYTSNLPISDENYGKNNDDPVFGANASTNTPNVSEIEDFSGVSYTYNPVTANDTVTDSVRIMNQQVRLWEDALRLNEWEKINVDNETVRDSLKNHELDKIEEKYSASNAAFASLIVAQGLTGSVVAYGLAATPVPGTAFAGYAAFAVFSGTGVALAEIQEERTKYIQEREAVLNKFGQSSANYSISGGNSFSSSISHSKASSTTGSFEYAISAELRSEVKATVSNTGVELTNSIGVDFSSGRDWTKAESEDETVSFTLFDGDDGDFFSVDVYPSILGWGPIFKRRVGGQTSCPYEDEELTKYYEPGTVISEATLQREKPTISSAPTLLSNIPVSEAAVFNLTIGNESESGDDLTYRILLANESNPFGALVTIDGQSTVDVNVPAGASINKVLAVNKGPGAVYNYDSLLILVRSICDSKIVDSVYISARFLPTCTDVELANPENPWVLNNSFNDSLNLVAAGYNINFFDLERLRLEYKPSSAANWIELESFWKDTTGQPNLNPIPTGVPFTSYNWDVSQLTDGAYDLRVSSVCQQAEKNSMTYSGVMDRINPHPFGTPSPADGILDPNDDIKIRFNEPVDLGALTAQNFDIRGVLNESALSTSSSLLFDGVDDYVEVSGGANIQNRSFTVEFRAKRDALGKQAVLSQGASELNNLFVGFNAGNQFTFAFGNEEVSATAATTDNNWHHFAAAYNFENETVELYIDGSLANTGNLNIFSNFTAIDPLYIGKNNANESDFFSGNLQDVRVWNRYRTIANIAADISTAIPSGRQGILYNWKFDEATGIIAQDHVRSRDGVVNGATWVVNPVGAAAQFDGVNQYIDVESGNVVITKEMDFTLEFWFNSLSTNEATLFSNGSANPSNADSTISWNITKDTDGKIHVLHNGVDFVAVDENYFDGEWHHFALVLRRNSNLSAYIDGNLKNTIQATNFEELGGSKFYLGCKGYLTGTVLNTESFFEGGLDEFRFWNTSRKVEQVARDKQNRLMSDELGLKMYVPFETYEEVLGVPVLTPGFVDLADNTHAVTENNGVVLSNSTPTIKIQRPVQPISFSFSVNNDEIIITPTVSPELIEKITLDITVENVKDLRGNVMQSPATWIAFVNKNQVIWQDELLSFEKDIDETITFNTNVLNTGGETKLFTIENLPEWLSASQTSGSITPNSSRNITFTINNAVNIGDYTQDIYLLTDFGYPEKLTVDLKVRATPPTWTVDPANFEYSMNIIGMLEINQIVSTDTEDVIAAFVDGETRGVANMQYIPSLDKYLVFLDVYSNQTQGENLKFRVWDASTGSTFTDVIPDNLTFVNNNTLGTLSNPVNFEAGNKITQKIPLTTGWNWISFNLLSEDSANLNNLLESVDFQIGNELKGQSQFSNYNGNIGWQGSLNSQGVRPELGYRIKVSQQDTIELIGTVIDPTSRNIDLETGWNWIGFVSIRNQALTQALGNLNPSQDDLIKGKSQFAIYDANIGWIGSLNTLRPGQSYMYQSATDQTFTFPFAGAFKNNVNETQPIQDERWLVNQGAYPTNMTAIITPGNCLSEKEWFDVNDWYVGVFDMQNNCRSLSELTMIENEIVSFATIAGNKSEALQIKLLHKGSGSEIPTEMKLDYQANYQVGKLMNPLLAEFDSEVCKKADEMLSNIFAGEFKVYPTIFSNELNVMYSSENAHSATISIVNLMGQVIYTQEFNLSEGNNLLKLDKLNKLSLNQGIYFLELRDSNNVVKTEKLIHY